MPADRGVNPHRGARGAGLVFQLGKLGIDILAHPVEPLEFKRRAACQRFDCAHTVSVVRRERRVNRIGRGKQLGRAGQVRDVGRQLAGEHRIIGVPANLAEFDFAVPVSAFDQPNHDPAAVPPRQRDHPLGQRDRAFGIGLQGEAKALPAGAEQFIIARQFLDDIQRQLEPLGFLGIDREMNVGIARLQRQIFEQRYQHCLGGGRVEEIVAREQG